MLGTAGALLSRHAQASRSRPAHTRYAVVERSESSSTQPLVPAILRNSLFGWPAHQRVVWRTPTAPPANSTLMTAESLASRTYSPTRPPLAFGQARSLQCTLVMGPAGCVAKSTR